MRLLILIVVTFGLLTACASTAKFDLTGVDASLTPAAVLSEAVTATGRMVVWGGVILSSSNLKDLTQIEMLAYPLDSNHLPQLDQTPLGRFIINHPGYLETTIYEAGRMVSVVGRVAGSQTGKVGEADYVYPLVKSSQLHLWSPDSGRSRTTFHFGLGVQL